MERVPCINGLLETEYNNFSLRRKIYHHSTGERYEFYIPFVVINQTQHDINLFNSGKQMVGCVRKSDNLLLDFQNFKQTKLRIKVNGYEASKKMDMMTAGICGTLSLNQEKSAQDHPSQSGESGTKSVEIGTSIKVCDHPFAKTRAIRFTNRFQIVNTLNCPIVVQEPKLNSSLFVIGADRTMVFDFYSENTKRLLQFRMSSKAESEKLSD